MVSEAGLPAWQARRMLLASSSAPWEAPEAAPWAQCSAEQPHALLAHKRGHITSYMTQHITYTLSASHRAHCSVQLLRAHSVPCSEQAIPKSWHPHVHPILAGLPLLQSQSKITLLSCCEVLTRSKGASGLFSRYTHVLERSRINSAYQVKGGIRAILQVGAQALLQILGRDVPLHGDGRGAPRQSVQLSKVQRCPVPHLRHHAADRF